MEVEDRCVVGVNSEGTSREGRNCEEEWEGMPAIRTTAVDFLLNTYMYQIPCNLILTVNDYQYVLRKKMECKFSEESLHFCVRWQDLNLSNTCLYVLVFSHHYSYFYYSLSHKTMNARENI